MSRPPSEPSSYQPPSALNPPLNSSPTSPSDKTGSFVLPQREHTTKKSHRFFQMFDHVKTVNFQASVIIHELGNVPQLAGDFAVSWKFRGRKPKGKIAAPQPMSAKPSLTNLKIGMTAVQPSVTSSAVSINSSSTASSPSTPTYPKSLAVQQASGRSTPIPTSAANAIAGPSRQHPHREESPKGPKKKTSDPTPLKQSTLPGYSLSSPEHVDTPLEPTAEYLHPDRAKDIVEEAAHRHLIPSALLGISQPNSAASSTSHLSVPFPRPAARSGTGPSVATLLDPLPGRSDLHLPRPPSVKRTPSSSSSSNVPSGASTPALSISRTRTASGTHPRPNPKSVSRKGTTPVRSLKAHTCTWDYEIQHAMRIPLGKPIPIHASGSATPRLRGQAPVVGAGPLSDSGLRLVIEQLPSKAAVAAPTAIDNDKEGAAGAIQAAKIHHQDKHHSAKGNNGADTHKTVFGTVDIDLAAFAGKGRMTRRFLLVGSRTNATIKLSVDMRWVGGEEKWAAPPMQEGHHVTGMRDLLGEEPISDLNLTKTASNTSSDSSSQSVRSRSNPSANGSVHMAANMSNASLVPPTSELGYKTYEHHLKSATPDPDQSSSDLFRRHTHRHRSHHSRHFRDPPAIQQFSMHDLSPDVVVEAVFNPHASNEEGPFTFKPRAPGVEMSSEAVVENLWRDLQDKPEGAKEEEAKEVKHGWKIRPHRARRETKVKPITTV